MKIMYKIRPSAIATALLAAVAMSMQAHAAATTISLDSLAAVTTAFPSTFYQGGGGSGGSLGFDAARNLKLHAATTGDVQAIANAYSAQDYSSALDIFDKGSITLTFNNVTLSHTNAGAYYFFNLGIGNNNTGNLDGSAVGQKIYFQVDRSTYSVYLRQRQGSGAASTLATWLLGSSAWSFADGLGSTSITSLSLTLSSTGWSATVMATSVAPADATQSGDLATPLVKSDWDGHYYIGLQTHTQSTETTRYVDGFVGSITINSIPEPKSVSALAGVGALAFAGVWCVCRRRLMNAA
ncbi:MAG: hypothetical protein LBK99_20625 [Opitutaceae bacterium]|jgi:hypothetical protein|nr:hypothetical protein [Opitutaceae bacterium]